MVRSNLYKRYNIANKSRGRRRTYSIASGWKKSGLPVKNPVERPRKHMWIIGASVCDFNDTPNFERLQRFQTYQVNAMVAQERYIKYTYDPVAISLKLKELFGDNCVVASIRLSCFDYGEGHIMWSIETDGNNGVRNVNLSRKKITCYTDASTAAFTAPVIYALGKNDAGADITDQYDARVYVYYREERTGPVSQGRLTLTL